MQAPRLPSRPRAFLLPAAALLGTLSLATVPASVAAQVLAQAVPSQYDLEVRPGQRVSRPLFLCNRGRERVKVRLRLADLRMSERGALTLVPPGTLVSTLARQLKLAPSELSLEPGERRVVSLEVTSPADGPATRYGVILSRVTPDSAAGAASTVTELGTTLFLTRAPRSSIRTELVGVATRVNSSGGMAVEVRVRNLSERHAPCSGEVKVSDAEGEPVISGFLADGVVLPNMVRVFGWKADRPLAPGRYTVTVSVDAGEPELLVGQKEIVVSSRGPNAARNE
jgi:hypothetical protein